MQQFDRAAENLGNSIHLEHVNVQVPDQRLAQLFYAAGWGSPAIPYLMVSDTNMWINVGRSQFHLPTGHAAGGARPHRPGDPGREALLDRLTRVKPETRRHEIRLLRAQRLRRGDLSVGQSRALLRAGRRALRAHLARHSLRRVRRAGRHRQAHRGFLSGHLGTPAQVQNGDGTWRAP